tara:strand:+ start:81 stop:380 length:300 start_codon:yes stop_codon:yes gene_type:complete
MSDEQKRYQLNEKALANNVKQNTLLNVAMLLKTKNDELTTQNNLLQTKLTKKEKIVDGRKVSNMLLQKNKATANLISSQTKTPVRRGGSRRLGGSNNRR